MAALRILPVLALLLGVAELLPQCSVTETQMKDVTYLLNQMLLTKDPNPSILLGLRLASKHNIPAEKKMLKNLQEDAIKKVQEGLPFSSGSVALYCLAMQACCEDPSHIAAPELSEGILDLGQLLEKKLNEELHSIETEGFPLTNYYQVSLDVLALCMMGKLGTESAVKKLIEAAENDKFSYGGSFSVDTGAVAVLALTCVKLSTKPPPEDVQNTIQQLISTILEHRQENGVIGNLYSTGLAMQALSVNQVDYSCSQTIQAIIPQISAGAFDNPMAASQIIPSLEGRSYLDVTKLNCAADQDNLPFPKQASSTPLADKPINVIYTVVNNLPVWEPFRDTITVSISKGSTLLDVMKKAEKMSPDKFRFTVDISNWGPFVTSIQGLYGNDKDHTYWHFTSGSVSLALGVGSYKPLDGEHISATFSKY
ncbi:transcobalamin-1-like [Erpetoichthys calabaricus]|uniref:transcobalamin-1-like n=1 Tax=Erpetoichthys calabaricus TaxID=27687 RepID=UPI002234BAF6|nr:transcobalamin-1-like [Erpetoichthys calabaricus]